MGSHRQRVYSAFQIAGPGLNGQRPAFGYPFVDTGTAVHPLALYVRPRNATNTTPAIASSPPHTVSTPGRSPVSAIDSAVATAGVR